MSIAPTHRDKELLDMATIQSQLPVYFRGTSEEGGSGSRIERLKIQCALCKENITEENQRGMLTMVAANEVRYEAVGVCYDCKHYTRAYYYIDSNLRLRTLRNGRWLYQGEGKKPSALQRLYGRIVNALKNWGI